MENQHAVALSQAPILVTGFEPFHGEVLNPSMEVARHLERTGQADSLVLPVSFARAAPLLKEKFLQKPTSFVLMLGQAGGRRAIGLERIAINLMDTDLADEDGVSYHNQSIRQQGPPAYLSPLPLSRWLQNFGGRDHIPCEISNSAGLFVCNYLYYEISWWLAEEQKATGAKALFVHLPYMTEQVIEKPAQTPSLQLPLMIEAIEKLLKMIRAG